MELTRDLLEARRLDLEQQKNSCMADLHALDGALQQVAWSLAKLDELDDQRPEEAQEEPCCEL